MKSLRSVHIEVALAAGVVLVAALAVTVALLVTPLQQVSLAGQTVGVGAAAPTLSLSGPGELDLFGQRLPTTLQFAGPVRPRLALTRITLGRQLATAFAPGQQGSERAIGDALASGWKRYFGWEIVISAGCALVLSGALAGWLRLTRRRTVVVLATGLALAEVVNLGGIMATAYTAPARLRQVSSIAALAGRAPLPSVQRAPGPPEPRVQVVVMGDSTAAGIGNPRPAHPTKLDLACGRSAASYAVDLGQINNWKVVNLACSGATIPAGILGPQGMPDATAPAQFAEAKKATHASDVIVSIGADDLGWSALLQLCAVTTCDDKASTVYFQQQLATFTVGYYQLLRRLAKLPSHPVVLVNLYYDPFDTTAHCLDSVGITPDKEKALTRLLDALNNVLANGARATGLIAVRPDFTGHEICDPLPYVQGLHGRAPFHPTVAGQLAIAIADSQALEQAQAAAAPSVPPGTASPGTGRPSSPASPRTGGR
ncbi:MAG TPA: GDSL-type esterase/lipase family protein [Streptosporangiaceae bacterium]|nr:GDSL-type esterase/lipase family protein [Streptosporangiaceae bacterium]